MTPRERKASGGTTATPLPAANMPAHSMLRKGADPGGARGLGWEEWFQFASAAQRTEMLALAARQGLLYTHQVPQPANGVAHKQPAQDQPHLQTLANLLAGKTDDLAPVATQPLEFIDQQLDRLQREAVARALFTPDVFLLQGLPGTGRSRVVAEILTQAALRGERALFLANHPCSLDAVLLRLVGSQNVLAVRFLDQGEAPESLPRDLLACTLTERRQFFREQSLENAARMLAEARLCVDRRRAEESCWAPLREILENLAGVQQRLNECAERLRKIGDDVQAEAAAGNLGGPFATELAQLERAHREAQQAVQSELSEQELQQAAAAAELEKVHAGMQGLRARAEAKKQGRWWTLAWWRATWHGQVLARMAELEGRQQHLESALQTLGRGRQDNQDRRLSLQDRFQVDRARLLQNEAERRRQEERRRESELQGEQQGLAQAWQQHLESLEIAGHRPTAQTPDALAAASACWDNRRRLDGEAYQFACRWSDYLTEAGDQLGTRIPGWANVLAGTLSGLSTDPSFAEAAAGPFDLLVLEEADCFTDADVLQAARHAARWVLVAQTQGPPDALALAAANAARPGSLHSSVPRLGCFQKLWHGLHCDSRRLHYAWSWENGRLCCTLRPVSASDRAHLEVEHVADFPEVELRILAIPKAPPLLAQVVFPACMTILEAKRFIYRELEEVAVQGLGHGAWLAEEADGFRFHLGALPLGETICLDLEKGLSECIAPETAQTCRLEFDRAAGWSRGQVDQWLQRHLHLRDLGRTIALEVPYRMMNGLAGSLNDILFAGEYLLAPDHKGPTGLEFHPVPALRKDSKIDEKRKPPPGINGFPALPREGAALEQDLTVQRSADRIPLELRAHLPRRGFANFLEAEALIRKLEDLAQQGGDAGEPMAVIALYAGQVELLRRLAARSEVLRRQPFAVEIGLPAAFQEREWMTVLVSLTRSHGHRAVPYGDRETDLAVALTRARKRLILFGDPGTLVKRSHWQGPLDHLDAAAAALEARRVTALLRWLAGSMQNSLVS